MRSIARLAAAVLIATPSAALAWGGTGHRIVGHAAMRSLPPEAPAFLRTAQAASDVGELSREPDRLRGAGRAFDSDRDPGHFVDVEDDGRILGGPALASLPPTRAEYESAMRAAGKDSWAAGYLPYSIVDRWQQLAKDFAYWRALAAAEANPDWKAHHDWFAEDRRRREALILRTLGELSHFVADGSQPLHVTSHYNGWGDYPNPQGYSTAKLHLPFEGDMVRATVREEPVFAKMAAPRSCGCPIGQRVADYLSATQRQVTPFYELEKAGGLAPGDPRGTAFAVERLAAGASELRDLIVEAWRTSESLAVGWKPVPVRDVLAGRTNPYPALYGID